MKKYFSDLWCMMSQTEQILAKNFFFGLIDIINKVSHK